MLREEIQEIQDIHGHNPMFATIPVHFVVVRDLGIGHVENPGIGDGDPEGISGDVFEHQIDAFGRRSGVDDPVLVKALFSDVLFNDQIQLEKSEYAVTPFKLNEMPKINEISHFAHIDYQAFAINDCAACF